MKPRQDRRRRVPGHLQVLAVLGILSVGVAPAGVRPGEPGTAPAATSAGQVVAQPFEVPVTSEPLYGVQPPSVDPDRQAMLATADDGVRLYVETWLPAPLDGHEPPDRLPTVLVATPYHAAGQGQTSEEMLEALVTRGYAYTRVHLRGTGGSGGCLDLLSPRDAQDVATAIVRLQEHADWANGRVGLSGLSGPGGAALNAVLRADTQGYVQAIEVAAPAVSMYAGVMAFDGVPQILSAQAIWPNIARVGVESTVVGQTVRPDQADRVDCSDEHAVAGIEHVDGSRSTYYEQRDMRSAVAELDVPLLLFHGHRDYTPNGVLPIVQAGFFDHLPDDVPHVGVFGLWDHEYPVENGSPFTDLRLEVRRADADRLRLAWFDHHLRDIDAGVDDWPSIQVQTSDGLWRVLDRWPTPTGTPGRLLLGSGGQLGATAPTGTSTYLEADVEFKAAAVPGTDAVFATPPLPDRLELAGVPVADLWLVLEQPDAHVVVRLEALDPEGTPIPGGWTYGSRSAQHLDPVVDGRFTQAEPREAPTGQPLRVPVRLNPTDLAVPAGGSLRLTVSGMENTTEGLGPLLGVPDPVLGEGTQPSGVVQTVTVLHSCDHPSALLFTMPDRHRYLTVRQLHPDDPTASVAPARTRFPRPAVDGGDLATADTCGSRPQ